MNMTLFKRRVAWIALILVPICAFANVAARDGVGETVDDTVEAVPKTAEKTSEGISEDGEIVVVENLYKFKATTLEDRVLETVKLAKENYFGPSRELMGLYKDEPDRVLALLGPYATHPDEGVSYTVLSAASTAHTAKALEVMGSIAATQETIDAARVIYENYSCKELHELGGQKLRDQLFRSVFISRYRTYDYLLLACYKDTLDSKVIRFLEQRRKSFKVPEEKTPQTAGEPNLIDGENTPRDITLETVSLDLALTELGKTDAQERIMQLLAEAETNEVMAFRLYLKYVTNKVVLLQAVELLKNKSRAQDVHAPDGELLYSSRIADEALEPLRERAGLPPQRKDHFDSIAPNYTDEELVQNYDQLKAIFEKLP